MQTFTCARRKKSTCQLFIKKSNLIFLVEKSSTCIFSKSAIKSGYTSHLCLFSNKSAHLSHLMLVKRLFIPCLLWFFNNCNTYGDECYIWHQVLTNIKFTFFLFLYMKTKKIQITLIWLDEEKMLSYLSFT